MEDIAIPRNQHYVVLVDLAIVFPLLLEFGVEVPNRTYP
jgi:hypothetical protein